MNEDELREALKEEILSEFDELRRLAPGSEEQQRAVANVAKLYELTIDQNKCDTDFDDKWNRRKMDEENQKNQIEAQKADKVIKYILEASAIILPLTFNWIWMRRGFRFEENGTYTSQTFRNLFNRFRTK